MDIKDTLMANLFLWKNNKRAVIPANQNANVPNMRV